MASNFMRFTRPIAFTLSALMLAACGAGEEGVDGGRDSGNRADGTVMDVASDSNGNDSGGNDGATNDTGSADGDPGDVVADAGDLIRCASGMDTDGDGIANDVECATGTDPYSRDSDGDGLSDGEESMYPRVCVASDRSMQRRPPQACTTTADCMTGETCNGLDPTTSDSDMDGVPDGDEDLGLDGTIDPAAGDTDPRLWDTNGDGRPDSETGAAICRPGGLATVVQSRVILPTGATQVGYDPRWSSFRRVAGTAMRGAVLVDDPAASVSGLVAAIPTMGDAFAEATRVQTIITSTIPGTTAVLVNRSLTTHEMNPAVTSTYRIATASSASALRDSLVMPLIGAAAGAGPSVGTSTEFLLDVTTVARTMGTAVGTTDVIITIAPRALYDDLTMSTSIRARDLVDATGVAEADKGLGFDCQVFTAAAPTPVEFLWTVDTSASMGDDQMRLGNVATQFFSRLQAAGVDFRVGVVQAGHTTLNLDTPGFHWIAGSDVTGPRRLCEEVTSATLGTCPGSTTDTLSPYPFSGSQEEPVSAAVVGHNTFLRRTMMGETNPDRRFRDGARVVAFFVTDEPGSNDFTRYFSVSSDPQTGTAWGTTYNAATRTRIIDYFQRNMMLTFGLVPVSATACSALAVADLPRCVIEGNGGAAIPIATATDAEISAAMMRIVEAVAGATSQYRLNRTPITSTIKVRVRGMDVPRSRSDGFDYDSVSNAIVFYGSTYRPNPGDEVALSYRIWQPCPARGAMCRSDMDCCSPLTCQLGVCAPPCMPAGATCTMNSDCCAPNVCNGGVCSPPMSMCHPLGDVCSVDADCCSPNSCISGHCAVPMMCRPMGGSCTMNSDCCSGSCTGGTCGCAPGFGACTSAADCCSGSCVDGSCGPG